MPGVVITAHCEDSLRLTAADGRTVQIPARCVLAIDRLLRLCLEREESVDVWRVDGEWEACLGDTSARGETPWQAVIALDEVLR
jgi:hypothetical protein